MALSQFTLSSGDFYMTWGRDLRGESITFACLPVDHEFLDALGIKVSDGRNFRADDEGTSGPMTRPGRSEPTSSTRAREGSSTSSSAKKSTATRS